MLSLRIFLSGKRMLLFEYLLVCLDFFFFFFVGHNGPAIMGQNLRSLVFGISLLIFSNFFLLLSKFLRFRISGNPYKLLFFGIKLLRKSFSFFFFLCIFDIRVLSIFVLIITLDWWWPWCNGYRRRKWTQWHEFKSWTRLIAFHVALIPSGKVWIQLFSLQLWVNSRTDWVLQPWWGI